MSQSAGGAWLVTGASGFLGRHLLECLDRLPGETRTLALVRDQAAWEAMDWPSRLRRIEPVSGDILETAWWSDHRLEGLRGVFHLAALVSHAPRDAEQVHRINVDGTLNQVRLAAERRCRLVFASTSGTVGCFRDPGGFADEDAPYCEAEVENWPYYRSKIAAERAARDLAGELGASLVILRPPVLLGPGDHRLRSARHVLRLLEGKLPFLIEGGMHFADVRDVAPAMVQAMRIPNPRPVYNLPGTQCTIKEFYHMVAELSGVPAPRRVISYRLARALSGMAARLGLSILPEPYLVEMAAHHWGLSSRYAEPDLGYRSRPGRATLGDTITWLRERAS